MFLNYRYSVMNADLSHDHNQIGEFKIEIND